jgi:hypothetical protein
MSQVTRVFLFSLLSSAGIGIATQADAFAVRRVAVECFLKTDGSFNNVSSGNIINNNTTSLFVYCPTPEDSQIRAQNITELNVHGKDASSTDYSSASVCWRSWFDDGGSCRNQQSFGDFNNPSAFGEFTLQLGTPNFSSTWVSADEANFKYVLVRLGAKGPASFDPSRLRGIYYAGPTP